MQWRRHVGWEPTNLGWRIAVLFMVGSLLFALGSLPAYAVRLDVRAVGVTFFVGSIFFTAAAASQFVDVARTGDGLRDPNWWACLVQLFGTFMFNVSTGAATVQSFDTDEIDRFVWQPDMIGSVAFLVASALAWWATCGRVWIVRTDDADWWVAALNGLGSVFFMASAIASWVLPTSGDVLNIVIVNAGTFLGAVGFFVGAYLLLPPAAAHRA